MFNFIVCEDDKTARKKVVNLLTKIMMPRDSDYVIHEFENFNTKMTKIVTSNINNKIYILDIELPFKSGLDIARQIRNNDWESVIIIITAHFELGMDAIKSRLMLLDFISKFNDFENRLQASIEIALKIIENKRSLTFEIGRTLYRVHLEDIIYISKDTVERKAIIYTTNGEYKVNENISNIMIRLDSRFFQTHRSCIVNKDYIKKIDFKEGKITFNNNEFIYMLARSNKKGLKDYVRSSW